MPPERAHQDATQAVALWRELTAAYDQLDQALQTQGWDDIAALAERIASTQRALEPLLVRRPASAADPAVQSLWRSADAHARALADRVPALERHARAARDQAASQLAKTRVARSRTEKYSSCTRVAPRFTSQRA